MIDLEWFALDADERLASGSPGLLAKHTALLAVGARYRRLRLQRRSHHRGRDGGRADELPASGDHRESGDGAGGREAG